MRNSGLFLFRTIWKGENLKGSKGKSTAVICNECLVTHLTLLAVGLIVLLLKLCPMTLVAQDPERDYLSLIFFITPYTAFGLVDYCGLFSIYPHTSTLTLHSYKSNAQEAYCS